METQKLPLVRLSLITPVAAVIESHGCDPAELYTKFGWPEKATEAHETFVTAQSMYDFFEEAANFTNNPFLGAHAAQLIDVTSWPPLREAVAVSHTLGECLFRIVREVQFQGTSMVYHLSSDGEVAILRTTRTFEPRTTPRQMDAFGISYLMKIIKSVAGESWDPTQVTAIVTDPDKFIQEGLPTGCIVAGGSQDTSVRFPADWLLITRLGVEGDENVFRNEPQSDHLRESNVFAVREIIAGNLKNPDLKIETVAKHCGLAVHELRQSLSKQGTTYAKELQTLKIATAKKLLTETAEPISNIATQVGFSTPANFTRAFKAWEGVLPKDFRKRLKNYSG